MLTFLNTIHPLILTVHFIVCLFLVVVILLQAGKGADIGAAFGAGSSQSLFGARGAATFLQKMTTGAALCFLLTSMSLAVINRGTVTGEGGDSVIDESTSPAPKEVTPAPAQPAAPTEPAPSAVPATEGN